MGRTIGELLGFGIDPFAEATQEVFGGAERVDEKITAPAMSLRQFVEHAWHVVEPELDFIPNWHVDAICEHLEWVAAGEIPRLAINIPPGHAKSVIVAVMWPAWMWHWRPGWRSIFGSYDQDLSTRDAVRSRMILTSPWYQGTFAPEWRFTSDQNVKGYYRNNRMGERMAVSVTGKSTGFRGHCVAVDDPINVKDRHSEQEGGALDVAIDWWDRTMSSRLNDPRSGARVIVMQRLHERDLTGHALRAGGYVHLSLASEFDPKRRSVTVTKSGERWQDPRQHAGDLLFPELFTPEVLEQAKKDLGSWQYAAQHGQNPMPASGGIFQKGYFLGGEVETPQGKKVVPDRSYRRAQLPPVWNETIQSWDMAFKKTTDSDFVVGQVWSRLGADVYLRFERRGRMGFAESKTAIRDVSAQFEEAHTKLVEDKANGPAIIDELRTEIPGLIAVPNNDGVLAHAWTIQGFLEAGNIHLPHPSEWPEVDEWLAEVCGYPKAAHDDRVAAFTQAVLRLMRNARGGAVTESTEKPKLSEAAEVAQSMGGTGRMPERF